MPDSRSQPESGTRPEPGMRTRRVPFEYAIVRVVPRVERGECVNAGIVLFCRARRYLAARVHLDEGLLRALAPAIEPDPVRAHLDAILRICAGENGSGPIARLPLPERFRWLTARSSTIVQPSDVHAGLTDDPDATLEELFRELVAERA